MDKYKINKVVEAEEQEVLVHSPHLMLEVLAELVLLYFLQDLQEQMEHQVRFQE